MQEGCYTVVRSLKLPGRLTEERQVWPQCYGKFSANQESLLAAREKFINQQLLLQVPPSAAAAARIHQRLNGASLFTESEPGPAIINQPINKQKELSIPSD